MTTTSVRLDDNLVNKAGKVGSIYTRTAPKQIEHWAKIGQIVEDNPNLSFDFVIACLKAMSEVEAGDVSEYEFR